MVTSQRADVCIIGGGCAAMWSALFLAQAGFQVTIVAEDPVAQFGSTRNQGWLHSGALYAAYGLDDVAAQCRDGAVLIEEMCPAAVSRPGSYFVVRGDAGVDRATEGCARSDVPFAVLSPTDMQSQPGLLGYLGRSDCTLRCVETPDRLVNTTMVLTQVLHEATRAGVAWALTDSISNVEIARGDDAWWIGWPNDTESIEATALILAAGSAIPALLRRSSLADGFAETLRVSMADVLVIPTPITSALIATLYMAGPNIVPFGGGRRAGATVTIAETDTIDGTTVASADRTTPPSRILDTLPAPYGAGLAELGVRHDVCRSYKCSKLVLADHPSYHGDLVSAHHDLLFSIYPRKFTSAPIAARKCADVVRDALSGLVLMRAAPTHSKPPSPGVSVQPYLADLR